MIALTWLYDAQPKQELKTYRVWIHDDTVKSCTVEDDICWDYVRGKIGAHWEQGGPALGKCFVPDSVSGAHSNCLDMVLDHN